ncbi:hypothetical protein QJS10_CPB20g00467 [Acorus calamus]|uniref:Uncharacterized protein n=1 Tax=Acorus calamus TaxID=4465 RepID=A0AAV9CD72_ACOCL|nr:hypothetical protein QJS10_CPB20g00467 [Acorus calamus]
MAVGFVKHWGCLLWVGKEGGILPERVNMKEVERLHGIFNKPAIKKIEDGDVNKWK